MVGITFEKDVTPGSRVVWMYVVEDDDKVVRYRLEISETRRMEHDLHDINMETENE